MFKRKKIILGFEIVDSTTQQQSNNWKRVRLINRLNRHDDLLKSYKLLVFSEAWQPNYSNICVLVSFNETKQSIRVKCESWHEPRQRRNARYFLRETRNSMGDPSSRKTLNEFKQITRRMAKVSLKYTRENTQEKMEN